MHPLCETQSQVQTGPRKAQAAHMYEVHRAQGAVRVAGGRGSRSGSEQRKGQVSSPVKSGRKRTKEKGRGLDKGLVQPELRPIGFNDKGVEH